MQPFYSLTSFYLVYQSYIYQIQNVRIWRPVYYSNNYILLFSNMIFVCLYKDRLDCVILGAQVISTKLLYIVLNENKNSSSWSGWSVFMYRIVTRQAISIAIVMF